MAQISSPSVRAPLYRLATSRTYVLGQHHAPTAPKALSASLGSRKRVPGALGDQTSLKLRNSHHLLEHEAACWPSSAGRHDRASPGFFVALGAYRATVGQQVALLAGHYDIDIEGDLASILPTLDDGAA